MKAVDHGYFGNIPGQLKNFDLLEPLYEYADALMLTCQVDEVNSRDFERPDGFKRGKGRQLDFSPVEVNGWMVS